VHDRALLDARSCLCTAFVRARQRYRTGRHEMMRRSADGSGNLPADLPLLPAAKAAILFLLDTLLLTLDTN